jgi:hypothetical protein
VRHSDWSPFAIALANAAFSVGERGRISIDGVAVGVVSVPGIESCVVTVQADRATAADITLMVCQLIDTSD